jgi:translation initiation factor 2D
MSDSELTEADNILREALLHCLSKIGQSSQSPELPIPSSTFYSSYILPNRRFVPSSSASSVPFNVQDLMKRSSHKKLSKFLSSAEKEGLLRLKQIQKPSPDTLILSLNTSHEVVQAHAATASSGGYRVLREEEEKRERREKAGKERENASEKAIEVIELWKPHAKEVVALFEAFNAAPPPGSPKNGTTSGVWPKIDETSLSANAAPAPIPLAAPAPPLSSTAIRKTREQQPYFTSPELKAFLDRYISSQSLVHPRDRKYVVLDEALKSALSPPQKLKKNKDSHDQEQAGTAGTAGTAGGTRDVFMTREELLPKLKAAMQPWYDISKGGKDGVRKCVLPTLSLRFPFALCPANQ